MSETTALRVNWQAWLTRWHRQQENYLPGRSTRFELILEAIAAQKWDGALRLLDLCCGPGSIAELALKRFPQATVLAVDKDPWLVEMGRQTVGKERRVSWLEADLRFDDWVKELEPASFDAIFTATAIHWFQPEDLVILYRNLASLLKEGGLFLNADHLPIGERQLDELVKQLSLATREANLVKAGAESWEQYWEVARQEPAFAELLAERDRRFADRKSDRDLTVNFHHEILKLAGFREVGEIWRYYNDAILVAIR